MSSRQKGNPPRLALTHPVCAIVFTATPAVAKWQSKRYQKRGWKVTEYVSLSPIKVRVRLEKP